MDTRMAGAEQPRTDTRAGSARVIVTLVHGTFARGAAWTREGSALRRVLGSALDEPSGNVRFDVFEWSGRNTHSARIKAGYELASRMRGLRQRHPSARHFLIGHSHGGNVALLAHKHLSTEHHAHGVATFGTPFVSARLPEDLVTATDDTLRQDTHDGVLFGTLGLLLALAIGLTTAMILYGVLSDRLREWPEWSAPGIAIAAGWALWAGLTPLLTTGLARLLYPFSPRRAAMKLGQALALKPMPQTHIISFGYPGDEAGLLLSALEKTSSVPTRAITWFKNIASIVMVFGLLLFVAAAFFSEPITRLAGMAPDKFEELAKTAFLNLVLVALGIWLSLVAGRYVLSLLRGHPAGFGWERPSLHGFVDIGVSTIAQVPQARSNAHQEVPFAAGEDQKGLRHSLLYEDSRILNALAYWIDRVR